MADLDHQSIASRNRLFEAKKIPLPATVPYGPPQVILGPGRDATERVIDESLAEQGGLPGVVSEFIKRTTGMPTALPGSSLEPETDPSPSTADPTI